MRTKNAFDALRRDTLGIKAPRPKKPLEKSDFVAEEAQESDDDEMLGIGRKVDDGEEEDGEDMDRTLETLVDDQEMNEETIAADRVFEKFQFVFSSRSAYVRGLTVAA
jgi:mediator of replication checkpoint protein 1